MDIYGLSKHNLRQKIPTPGVPRRTDIKLIHLYRMRVHVPTVDMQISLTSILGHLNFSKDFMEKWLIYIIHSIFSYSFRCHINVSE